MAQLNDYHLAAARAHREHSQTKLNMPSPVQDAAAPWAAAGVIVADADQPGLNGHNNPDQT
jgi:hypothetical protein